MNIFQDVIDEIKRKNGLDSVGGIVNAGDAILKNLKGGGGAPAPLPNPANAGTASSSQAAPVSIPEIGGSILKQYGMWIAGGLAGLIGLWLVLGRKGGRK